MLDCWGKSLRNQGLVERISQEADGQVNRQGVRGVMGGADYPKGALEKAKQLLHPVAQP